MRVESKKFLWDMQRAGRRVQDFTRGRTREHFDADVLLRSAVERQFEIVGEALTNLRKQDPVTASRITDHTKIIGFRNVLIHGYATVDDDVTWRIVSENLPVLLAELDALLAEPETDD